MRYGSVCSGIEAATSAWHPLGWKPSFFSEIEPFPRAVLAQRWPDVPCHGDFTTIQAGDYDPIDLLVGGTPCQSFSVAGLRGGLADNRGNLALEFLRLADRLRPRWLVWENVPGVLSSVSHDAPDSRPPDIDLEGDNGPADGEEVLVEDEYDAVESHAFGCFLAGLSELGYGFAYRILDAQFFGVPQRRRRVFVVGYLGDWRRAAAVLFERESLSGNPPPRRETGKRVADSLTVGANQCSGFPGDFVEAFGGNNQSGPIDVATALNAHGGPAGWLDFESETFIAHAIQAGATRENPNSGPDGVGIQANVAYTLEARAEVQMVAHALRGEGFDASEDGTGRGTPLVPVAFQQNSRSEVRLLSGDGQIVGAIAADPGAQQQNYAAFDCKAGGKTSFAVGDHAGSLRGEGHGGGHAAVAFNITPSNSNKDYNARATERAQAVTAGGNRPSARGGDQIAASMAVRRLTPRECERLQGFPDDYTLIEMRGKPAADGPRYKALGNSMAVCCMRWIGERIEMVEGMA